jgi:REP element-mobilizing transposase RayT
MEIDIIEPFYYYHIYNRGINKQPIFFDASDYKKFLAFCAYHTEPFLDVLAYCLIPNHFHMLIYVQKDCNRLIKRNLSNPIGNWLNAYAQYFNKKTDRTGSLFQRPFKRKRITTQEYLMRAIYYIHRNPMHHRITNKPENYTFSSYKTITEKSSDSFIKKDHVLTWFENSRHFDEYHRMNFELDETEFFD